MIGACPRCNGSLYYQDHIISCLACGNIVQDDTPIGVNYERPWKYKLHKMYKKRQRR
jgi:hypothetical protein